MNYNLTLEGENLIKEFEGLRLKAYKCSAGKWTIGWGSTTNVKAGDEITIEEAQERFWNDIKRFEDCIKNNVQVKLTNNEFSALVSFCYNIGCGAFKKSTLLRKLNKGWYEDVPKEMLRWVNVNGEPSGGLHRRRVAEIKLWSKKDEECN